MTDIVNTKKEENQNNIPSMKTRIKKIQESYNYEVERQKLLKLRKENDNNNVSPPGLFTYFVYICLWWIKLCINIFVPVMILIFSCIICYYLLKMLAFFTPSKIISVISKTVTNTTKLSQTDL